MTIEPTTLVDRPYDVDAIRADFPALLQEFDGNQLAYLDSGATSQKPQAVIAAIQNFYLKDCANIHRGVHRLSVRATAAYENARASMQRFLNARSTKEIIFVRSATEAINLVSETWSRTNLTEGDEVLISHLEHHSNIVPWQIACQRSGARLRVIPIDDAGALRMDEFERLLTPKTKIVAISHISNALGTINPIKEITAAAHAAGAVVLVDGAQAAPHTKLDVQDLDVDFYAVSGHKMYGPTGSGVLYGKQQLLEALPPYQGGGDMILSVTFEGTTYNELPHKFEAGTPDIAAAIGLGAAAEYLTDLGLDAVAGHEHTLLEAAIERLGAIRGLKFIGTAPQKAALVSFTLEGVHPHDLGTILDQHNIAVRTGHHCAQPVMERYGIPATTRASFGLYNTVEEVERLAHGIEDAQRMFGA